MMTIATMISEALIRSGIVSVLTSLVSNFYLDRSFTLDKMEFLASGALIDYATDALIPLIPMVIPLGGDLRRIAVGLVLSWVIATWIPLIPGTAGPAHTRFFTTALPIVNYVYGKFW